MWHRSRPSEYSKGTKTKSVCTPIQGTERKYVNKHMRTVFPGSVGHEEQRLIRRSERDG